MRLADLGGQLFGASAWWGRWWGLSRPRSRDRPPRRRRPPGSAPRSRMAATCPGTSLAGSGHDETQEGQALASSRRPVMPKSSKRHPPVGLHEAGCRRAGRRGRRRRACAPSRKAMSAARNTASVSMPAARIASTSPQANPSSRSITSTRRVTRRGWGRGTTRARWPVSAEDARHVEHVLRLEPEVELLDDRLGEQLDERGRVGERGDRDAPDELWCDPAHGGEVALARAVRSVGRWTLTTTSSPVLSRAAWTWAIEAAAIGTGRRRRTGVSSGCPRSSSTMPPDDVEALRRNLVAAEPELGDELLGEDPLPDGQDLAELDVGGARGVRRLCAVAGTIPSETASVREGVRTRTNPPPPSRGAPPPAAPARSEETDAGG